MEGNLSDIFITHVGDDGPLLKIWGQIDKQAPMNIERLIGQYTSQFNQGIGIPTPKQLFIGQLCCAQYLDGTYYRARITSLENLNVDQIGVQFADYGNHEIITLNNIRVLEGVTTPLLTCADQAMHFFLANVAPLNGAWNSESLKFVKDTVCYMDLKFTSVGKIENQHFIRVQLQNGMDLGDFLASRHISVTILLETQAGVLNCMKNNLPMPKMQLWPRFNPDVPPPLPIAQMMVTQQAARAVEDNIKERFTSNQQQQPPPGLAAPPTQMHVKSPSSRLLMPGRDAYGAPAGHVPNAPPGIAPMTPSVYGMAAGHVPAAPPGISAMPTAVPYPAYAEQRHAPTASPATSDSTGFEVRRLTLNTAYPVKVVCVEDGPEAFIVFLQDMQEDLARMLADINAQQPIPLTAPPMVGTICLGRSLERTLLRAVVIHVGNTCKLYFVDFGTTEEVAFDDIYTIPPHYVGYPKPMCVRITHGGLNSFEVTKEIKEIFASMVLGKSFTLYVTVAEGHHLKQCGILFEEGKSVLNNVKMLLDARKSSVFQTVPTPKVGATMSIAVQHIESMRKFFVTLEDSAPTLQALMVDLATHCRMPGTTYAMHGESLCKGLVCCAQYAEDEQWYRALVLDVVPPSSALVHYVDYGNCETVEISAMRVITPKLVSQLKAQAIECCLSDFDTEEGTEEELERFTDLVVDKTLIAYVVKHTAGGVPVVSLHDLSATPLLSVGVELEKLKKAGSVAPTPAPKVVYQFSSQSGASNDSKYRSGASREEPDWRARPSSSNSGKVDTWEASREGQAANSNDGFPPHNVRSGDVKAAQLVYTETPEDFYVQITPDIALVDLMADISTLYSKGGRPLSRPSRGAMCVARFADDGEWYRATVQSADTRVARVSFIDFGNVDDVPLKDVCEIAPAFTRLPVQAVRCCLSGSLPKGSEWTAEEIAEFTKLIDERPLEVKFGTERNGVFSVQVTDGETGEKINDKFCAFVDKGKPAVSQGYNKPTNSYDKPSNSYDKPSNSYDKPSNSYDKPSNSQGYDRSNQAQSYDKPSRSQSYDKPEQSYGSDRPNRSQGNDRPPRNFADNAGGKSPPYRKTEPARVQEFARPDERLSVVEIGPADCQEVGVTWFISPEEFYVSQASTAAAFDKLMRELQPAYRATKPITDSLEVGAPCVAVFAEDKSFCRAEVTTVPNPYAYVVRYVDYGNCDLVAKKDLFPIETKFLQLPKVAVLCSLLNVKPTEAAWPKVSDKIDALFRSDKYQCTFHEYVDGKYFVSLTDKATDVASALIEKGLAVCPPPPAPPATAAADEPVKRDLLVGQTLRVNVTYVEAICKFYVHLGVNRVVEIQAAVDAYVAKPENKKAFPASEVQVDRMCIASADGTQWYRARIVDCTGTAGIFVSFVDYGDGDEVTADKMISIPDSLAALPVQAVECTVAGSADADIAPDLEDAFKSAVEGEDVIVTVTALVDGILSVHVFGVDGLAQPQVAEIGQCPPTVSTLTPLPVLSQHCAMFVAHADDTSNVWLQRSADTDTIAELLGALYAFYEEEKSGEPVAAVAAGLFCAARASDEQWYRAEVLAAAEGDLANVRFLDYGNAEEVALEHLRALDERFLSPHILSVHVRLPVVPALDLNVDLIAMTTEAEYKVAFAREVDNPAVWMVELFHGKETFSDALVELGLELVEGYPFVESRERLTTSPKVAPGVSLAVFVSHVGGPDDIWLQLAPNVEAIELLQEELQTAVNQMEDLAVPVVGDMGAAIFSDDGSWYRAEVLTANTSVITVRFVDYGNKDGVDILTKPLKRLPPKLAAAERYATRCRLNVSPIDREFGPEVVQRINELVLGDENEIIATGIKEGNVIDLSINGKSLFEILTEEALVVEFYDPNTVFVCHAISPAEFFVQYQNATYQLEAMTERMTEAADFLPLAETAVGTLCAAQFDDDEAWYRAKIVGTSDEGVQVFFVDFGNSSVTNQLRALPEDLTILPPVAKRCSLVNAKRLTPAAMDRFAAITSDTGLVMEVIAFADPVVVELTCDGKKVSETLAKVGGLLAEGDVVPESATDADEVSEESDNAAASGIDGNENPAGIGAVSEEALLVESEKKEEEAVSKESLIVESEKKEEEVVEAFSKESLVVESEKKEEDVAVEAASEESLVVDENVEKEEDVAEVVVDEKMGEEENVAEADLEEGLVIDQVDAEKVVDDKTVDKEESVGDVVDVEISDEDKEVAEDLAVADETASEVEIEATSLTAAAENGEVADEEPIVGEKPVNGEGTVVAPKAPIEILSPKTISAKAFSNLRTVSPPTLESVPEDNESCAAETEVTSSSVLETVVEAVEASDDSYESAKGGDDDYRDAVQEGAGGDIKPDAKVAVVSDEAKHDAKKASEQNGSEVEASFADSFDAEISAAFAAKPGRVTPTPHDQRIVAGAVSLGLSEEELAESIPNAEDISRELEAASVQATPSRSPESTRLVIDRPQSCPAVADGPTPTHVRLPHSERIVPGTISCNVSMDYGLEDEEMFKASTEGENFGVKADTVKTQVLEEAEHIGQGDEPTHSVVNGNH